MYVDLTRTVAWDAENRIRSVSDTAQSANLLTEKYWYNDAGQRVIKRTIDSDSSANGETEYINQFVSISRSDGQQGYILTKNYYLGNEREASSVAPVDYGGLTETTYFYHTDHLGSSTYLMDSNGNIAEHIEYTPWGEMWNEQAMAGVTTTPIPHYYFTSKELDLTSLYYFGARYYDPQTSVWQSPDPAIGKYLDNKIGDGGIFNPMNIASYSYSDTGGKGVFDSKNLALYSYCHQNPVIYIDPNGLWHEKSKDVEIKNLVPEMKNIEETVDTIYGETGATNNPAITSGSESTSKHKAGSKHYENRAIDLEIWGLKKNSSDVTKSDVQKTADALKKGLGKDYVVLNEWDAPQGPHIHVQYNGESATNYNAGNYGAARESEKNAANARGRAYERQ
jgi:RHS repeat-associated protein